MGVYLSGMQRETIHAALVILQETAGERRRRLGAGPDVLLLELGVGVLERIESGDDMDDTGERGVVRD